MWLVRVLIHEVKNCDVCVVVNGTQVGQRQVQSFLPNVTTFTLRLPDRSTRYKFYLAARTQVGAGEVYAEESPNFSNEGELSPVYTHTHKHAHARTHNHTVKLHGVF